MEINLKDTLLMKKKHPCSKEGSEYFEVMRVGMDIRVKCKGCGRQMLLARDKVEKNIKKIIHNE